MPVHNKQPSEHVEDFLNFLDSCMSEYKLAYDTVNEEDKKLQDFVHALEFEHNCSKRNRIGTQLHQSRNLRRECKDAVKRNESIVKFFEEPANRTTWNKLRQLLGKQRKEEEYLDGERVYKPRVKQ